MKKKIILIIIVGILITFFIYRKNENHNIYLLSLGDGLATGMTAYNVEGYSYNDYIRDYLESEHILEKYVSGFAKTNQTIENLITCVENNYQLEETNIPIQQALSKAKIITIGIGLDELANTSLKTNIPTKEIEDYKKDMEHLIKIIRNFNDKKIYILGLYKAYNITDNELNSINDHLKSIADKYHAIYIDIQDLIENPQYFLLNNSYYLNYKGHKEISNRILGTINT